MTTRQDIDGGLAEIDPAPPSDPPRLGELTAEIISNVQFLRQVERLCRRPRVMAELLAELGAERLTRTAIETKMARFAALSDKALAATGGDQMPPTPLHEVRR